MAALIFQYLADRVMGTNISGQNGHHAKGVDAQDYNRLYYYAKNLESRFEKMKNYVDSRNESAVESYNVLYDCYKTLESDYNRAIDVLNNQRKVMVEVLSGFEDISSLAYAKAFIEVRMHYLLFECGVNSYEVDSPYELYITKEQLAELILNLLAYSDYMMLKQNFADVLFAIGNIINNPNSLLHPELSSDGALERLIALRAGMHEDFLELHRTDINLMNVWVEERVNKLRPHLLMTHNERGLITESVPSMYPIEEQYCITPGLLTLIHDNLSDAKRALFSVKDGKYLFPMAFQANAYGIHDVLAKILIDK